MSKRRKEDGPGLFGDGPAGPGAYEKPAGMVAAVATGEPAPERERLRPIVAELAAEVLAEAGAGCFRVGGDAIDRIEILQAKIRQMTDGMIEAIAILDRNKGLLAGSDAARVAEMLGDAILLETEAIEARRRQSARLRTAIERAIELIQPERGSFVGTQPMLALAVLRECLIPEVANGSRPE